VSVGSQRFGSNFFSLRNLRSARALHILRRDAHEVRRDLEEDVPELPAVSRAPVDKNVGRTHKVQRERGVVRRRVLDADVGQQARELRVRDCRRPSVPAPAYDSARTVAPVEEGEQVQSRQARQDVQVDYPHPRVSTDARAADADTTHSCARAGVPRRVCTPRTFRRSSQGRRPCESRIDGRVIYEQCAMSRAAARMAPCARRMGHPLPGLVQHARARDGAMRRYVRTSAVAHACWGR
jgi:hypothetical protein